MPIATSGGVPGALVSALLPVGAAPSRPEHRGYAYKCEVVRQDGARGANRKSSPNNEPYVDHAATDADFVGHWQNSAGGR